VDQRVSFVRIDLEEIRIAGDTVRFYTSDGPRADELRCQEIRCKTAKGMAELLNRYADQFVPIYDDDDNGTQINRYYGDKSIGMNRPGDAFRTR